VLAGNSEKRKVRGEKWEKKEPERRMEIGKRGKPAMKF